MIEGAHTPRIDDEADSRLGALVFDRYQIQGRIAVGGMGEIFMAWQVGVAGRPVILKRLLPEIARQAGSVEQFLDEARVAATLNHPNVVSVYEVGAWHGEYYMAMEYVDGVDLARILNRSLERTRQIPHSIALRIVSDAAAGLDHAHRARGPDGAPLAIVHRDISPQNIMVRRDGLIKVVDFGVAHAKNRLSRTEAGVLKGKIAYMAPERFEGVVDARSDQYALGVVLWELLTRRPLFQGEDVQVIRNVMKNEIARPSSVNASVSADVDSVVMRMLNGDPALRFAALSEVSELLAAQSRSLEPGLTDARVGEFVVELTGAAPEHPSPPPQPSDFLIGLRARDDTAPDFRMADVHAPGRARTVVAVSLATALTVLAGAAWFIVRQSHVLVPPSAAAEPPSQPVVIDAIPAEPLSAQPAEPTVAETPAPTPPRGRGKAKRGNGGKTSAEADAPGVLTLKTTPWSRVTIDGKPYGSTPLFRVQLSSGVHDLALSKAGGAIIHKRIVVKPGEASKLDIALD